MSGAARRDRWRRAWDESADTYDARMGRCDRWLFRDSRSWVCDQAHGEVLEVAVGTGLNLPLYPSTCHVTGIDLSPGMLRHARRRRDELGRHDDLRLGDAEHLDLPDRSVDCVVCTFSCCAIPDHRRALTEMLRVLRPGGRLLLADHVASDRAAVRLGQRLVETVTVAVAGEHFTRRPYADLPHRQLAVERHERFALGVVERLAAVRVP